MDLISRIYKYETIICLILILWKINLNVLCVGRLGKLSDHLTAFETARITSQKPSLIANPFAPALTSCRMLETGLYFKVYGAEFEFIITHSKSLFLKEATLDEIDDNGISEKKLISMDNLKLFEGVLKDMPNTTLSGICADQTFNAWFTDNKVENFFESASKYFENNKVDPDDIVLYKNDEFHFKPCTEKKDYKFCFSFKNDNQFDGQNVQGTSKASLIRARSRAELKVQNKACLVELVADQSFYEKNGANVERTIGEMMFSIKYANNILKATDFNGDHLPDNVQLIVKHVAVYKSKDSKDYTWNIDKDISLQNILQGFSKKPQKHDFCLSILFTSFVLEERTEPGAAYTAKWDSKDYGICAKRNNENVFGNVLLVNDFQISGDRALQKLVGLTAIHEIGHAFGSPHDDFHEAACFPGDSKHNYIMYEPVFDLEQPSKTRFSPCSVSRMAKVLEANGNCLVDLPSDSFNV